MTSFSRQKPLKSKNKKHRIFWNTEFYHPAKFELKRIKNAKVVSSLQLFACVLAQRATLTADLLRILPSRFPMLFDETHLDRTIV